MAQGRLTEPGETPCADIRGLRVPHLTRAVIEQADVHKALRYARDVIHVLIPGAVAAVGRSAALVTKQQHLACDYGAVPPGFPNDR
jgi:hypothetical protein